MSPGALKVLSVLFGILYLAAFYVEWSPFRYYPETNHFHLSNQPGEGPAILWYGWVAVALVGSIVAALVVPRRVAERISSDVVWVVTVGLVLAILLYEKRWFF